MNPIFKGLLIVIAVLVYVYVGNYTFNHINPWLGILLYLLGPTLAIYFVTNKIKKTKE